MLRDKIIEQLNAHKDELRLRFSVQSVALFGSVARGDERADSDVDMIVTFEQTPGILAFIELKQYLEALLDRRVDLVTADALKRQLRDQILKEAIRAA